MSHRPLSAWVCATPLSTAGVAQWGLADDINFGDERADARDLPRFAAAWRRRAVPVDLGYAALGLLPEVGDVAVLELDDFARPVRVTQAGADVISRIEEGWPNAGVSAADADMLAGEVFAVRDLLLTRLAADGQPPPGLFHILPWYLVDRLAQDVTATLGGAGSGQLIELGHWFTSTGSRFTAALEQLDEGLREQDAELIRVASTALCERLLTISVDRVPTSTRQALAALASTLPGRDPFLAFGAARAVARLRGDETRSTPAPRLSTLLLAAAADTPGVRRSVLDEVREPFAVRLAVTATGKTEVSLRATVEPGIAPWLAQSYGVLLLPVIIRGGGEELRYVIALGYSRGQVSGAISVPSPRGRFVEADVAGIPIGAAEVPSLSPDEVKRSIRSLKTEDARLRWRPLADRLPAGHPLRAVIEREAR